MLKVGLTGGIAAGKSTVCSLFSEYNVPIIDADIIARELVEAGQPALSEIETVFGPSILKKDRSLNRGALGEIIFSNAAAKLQLEKILHPRIHHQLSEQSNAVQADYCILAIPLLIENHWQESVDRILVIDIDLEQQIDRLCLRDTFSRSEAQKRIASQCSRERRLSYADDIISNNLTTHFLNESVQKLDEKYRFLAKHSSTACQHVNSQRQ